MDEKLLNEVKSYLNFTWEDEDREDRIVNYILSSVDYLNMVAGVDLDFDTDLLAKDLLFNRVLYMDSQALPDFQINYAGMMNELRVKYRVG